MVRVLEIRLARAATEVGAAGVVGVATEAFSEVVVVARR